MGPRRLQSWRHLRGAAWDVLTQEVEEIHLERLTGRVAGFSFWAPEDAPIGESRGEIHVDPYRASIRFCVFHEILHRLLDGDLLSRFSVGLTEEMISHLELAAWRGTSWDEIGRWEDQIALLVKE